MYSKINPLRKFRMATHVRGKEKEKEGIKQTDFRRTVSQDCEMGYK
jgi:hypothetical protein